MSNSKVVFVAYKPKDEADYNAAVAELAKTGAKEHYLSGFQHDDPIYGTYYLATNLIWSDGATYTDGYFDQEMMHDEPDNYLIVGTVEELASAIVKAYNL